MIKTEILLTGTGVEKLRDYFNDHGDWRITTATTDEEAIENFHRHYFEVVVLTKNVSDDEERKLRKIFTFHNPDIIIVKNQHRDEGMLVAEIAAALEKLHKAKKPSYSLVDDALKNAGLNIIIE